MADETARAGVMREAASPRGAVYVSQAYSLWPDRVVEGAFMARAESREKIVSNYPLGGEHGPLAGNAQGERTWTLTSDLHGLPRTRSGYPLLDALYDLSLEELQKDTRADGALNAGAKWQGVWTRDVSYSIVLSLAAVAPEAARLSLLQKVKRDRIVQDTGSGGSWPVSSDRVTWALAAWEVYLVTGDQAWLRQSYAIVRNSILDDQHVVIDPTTGLARGETSFLDWREQTYPRWMEPVDIYSSKALGTNAVFYRVYRILGSMARALSEAQADWDGRAERIRSGLNRELWQGDKGYYGAYQYGSGDVLSPRAEALGEALAILFDIPDGARQAQMVRSQPLMAYGVPTVFPQSPGIPPYHNRSVWPFVQAYWNLAAAKAGDEGRLLYGLGALYRASALFLTNKENLVAETGHPDGTEINSDRQLWSVAGNLAMVYRVFFGMQFTEEGLRLEPVIPAALGGTRTLTGFRYRQAVLSIEVRGSGSRVKAVRIDGRPAKALVSAQLVGAHAVVIEMEGAPGRRVEAVPGVMASVTALETPEVVRDGDDLRWKAVEGASGYAIYRDGRVMATVTTNVLTISGVGGEQRWHAYQVQARGAAGRESFLSAPVEVGGAPVRIAVKAPGSAGSAGEERFVTVDVGENPALMLQGRVDGGRYRLRVRYANGSGPVNTENKCAVRTLYVDGVASGPIVMPQRGEEAWADWGMSSAQVVALAAGEHRFELRLEPWDTNMNEAVNRARIAGLVLDRVN